ncbi:YbfB/YjiJ family MFS transporter [Deinococcus deserti]|uniref:Putative major facilitator superfamily protein putative membrane protein n=1 Tax=Deinococcus deserti (strain DSM 17065 / CIP 109153 / LMG 22923 / VCD115) TaxID=546414 RepID=C1D067_DEIDV|nr:YbfB/YjiJ family MFS transporter [Deinococcus deserti]ACO47336.1 putative major facilitator superfamily protein; putative membrane protein [Deinococcus deserti VCD115]
MTPQAGRGQTSGATRALLDMLALSLGGAVALGFARFAYALLLPVMRADLNWSFTLSGSMNAVNALGYLLGALSAGWLSGRVGLRRTFVAGMLLTAVSLLACALTSASGALLLWRLLAGLGGAWVFVSGGGLAALAARAHPEHSARLLGVFYGGAGIGIVLSALLLPPLLTGGWRGAWVALGATSLLCLALTLRALRRLPDRAPALPEGEGPTSLQPLGFTLAAYACFGVGYIAYMTFIVAFLRSLGAEALVTPFWTLLGVCVMINPFVWGPLMTRAAGARAMSLLMLLLCAGAALPLIAPYPAALLLSAVLFGLSFLAVVTFTTVITRRALPEYAWARGIAVFTSVFALGQVAGPLLTGLAADSAGGLRLGLALSAAVLLLGAGLALGQPAQAPTTTHDV